MVRVRSSAYKHGVTKQEIAQAIKHQIGKFDLDPDTQPPKILVNGPDLAGNVLEILGTTVIGNELIVFHAMALRKKYMKNISIEENR